MTVVLTPATSTAAVEAYITLHLQPSEDPILTNAELTAIVALASIADSEDRSPDDVDWEATYDVASAIAQGWEIKAAKVVGAYRFKDTGLELHRDQVHDHCLKQAALWRSRAGGAAGSNTIQISSEAVDDAIEEYGEVEELLD